MARPVFVPRSLSITRKFATQGMKSVITVRATTRLHRIERAGLLHCVQSRRAVVAPQEADEERVRGLCRQPEPADDDGREQSLQLREQMEEIEEVQQQSADDEQRHGLFQVPLRSSEDFDQDVRQFRRADRRNLENEVAGFARDELRGEPADEEDRPRPSRPPRRWPARFREAPSMAMMTPSCAEHGTPRASSSVTITTPSSSRGCAWSAWPWCRSRGPSTIGRTAFPLRPIRRNSRLSMTASRGR